MANRFQKFLFNLSTMSPLIFILVIVYWIEQNVRLYCYTDTAKVQISLKAVFLIVIILGSIIFSLYGFLLIKFCERHLERIPIAVDAVSSNDMWVIAVVISYALPAASFVFEDCNQLLTGIIILVLFVILAISNVIIPSPLLMLGRYHFYKITNINGGGEICLLSKRTSIVNRNSITKIIYAFDYLAIERGASDV